MKRDRDESRSDSLSSFSSCTSTPLHSAPRTAPDGRMMQEGKGTEAARHGQHMHPPPPCPILSSIGTNNNNNPLLPGNTPPTPPSWFNATGTHSSTSNKKSASRKKHASTKECESTETEPMRQRSSSESSLSSSTSDLLRRTMDATTDVFNDDKAREEEREEDDKDEADNLVNSATQAHHKLMQEGDQLSEIRRMTQELTRQLQKARNHPSESTKPRGESLTNPLYCARGTDSRNGSLGSGNSSLCSGNATLSELVAQTPKYVLEMRAKLAKGREDTDEQMKALRARIQCMKERRAKGNDLSVIPPQLEAVVRWFVLHLQSASPRQLGSAMASLCLVLLVQAVRRRRNARLNINCE